MTSSLLTVVTKSTISDLVDVPDSLLLSVSIHSLSNTANMMIIVFYYFSSRERHGDYSKMIYDFKI